MASLASPKAGRLEAGVLLYIQILGQRPVDELGEENLAATVLVCFHLGEKKRINSLRRFRVLFPAVSGYVHIVYLIYRVPSVYFSTEYSI
jgi:hypothetical protein